MKTKLWIAGCMLVLALSVCHAATRQWSYVLPNVFGTRDYPQIAADGKGGCAIIYYDSSGAESKLVMVWLDKNGNVKFKKEHTDAVWYGSEIILCTTKNVVYGYTGPVESFVTICIDNKGVVSRVGGTEDHEAATTWGDNDVRSKCEQADKKGFFVIENLPPDGSSTNIYRLSRYTCK